ncbi:MAG TPA: AraC family transcriptional regulator [Pararhizobium sp.]|uniref:AraC family transcriptional regulator n=1 Tax=Pararhizobium sp. TaxID=1977563 RepID=UPI002C556DF8|nr:AraC family transcriptional regulator [Pararhizobium sp.]HTO33893.1 AraC family transcriptional regulator [Pararhizobium sp.]
MQTQTDNLAKIADIISRHVVGEGSQQTIIDNLFIGRQTAPTVMTHSAYRPVFALVVGGEKSLKLGQEIYNYGAGDCLVVSVDLPVSSKTITASPEKPHLGVAMVIDPDRVREVLQRIAVPAVAATAGGTRGLAVTKAPPSLVDATLRYIQLLDTPDDIPGVAPLIEQEILYRLLTGVHASRLIQIATADSPGNRIAKAIAWLRDNYTRPLRIEDLADHIGMSVSSLHHHFKAVTAMTPMQYQKQLRLNEARRLMLVENMDAGNAGHTVGYQSPSQFGLEYTRLYGLSPLRDIAALRMQVAAE